MRIQRIRVEKFKKLVNPVEIRDLPQGMAIIGGDNEEGKSTLLDAVRTVLFEKHRLSGQSAEAMQPIGQDVAPSIELDFWLGDRDYRLRKTFVKKTQARLESEGQVWEGDAVEDELQSLLNFDRPGRGVTQPQHQGLIGLLWVSQGATFERVTPNTLARNSLANVLEGEVGEVLGGSRGQALLDHFVAERDRFWGRTGKPIKELKRAKEQWQAAQHDLEATQQSLKHYQEREDRLERIEGELRRYRDEQVLERMKARLGTAQDKQQELTRRREALGDARRQQQLVEAHLKSAQDHWAHRKQWRDRLNELEEAVVQGQQGLNERHRAAAAAEREHERRKKQLTTAEQTERSHAQAVKRCEGLLKRLECQAQRDALAKRLDEAQTNHTQAQEARRKAHAIAVTAQARDALREREQALTQDEARLAASATDVTVAVSVDYQVTGEAQKRDDTYQVTGAAEVHLAGVGRVSVRAGGADLDQLQERLHQARQARDDQLEALGVTSQRQAESELNRKQALEREAQHLDRLVRVHAPDGIEALRQQKEALDAQMAAFAQPQGSELEKSQAELQNELKQAQSHHEEAQQTLDEIRQALEAQRDEWQRASNQWTQAQTSLGEKQDQKAQTQQQLDNARAEFSDAAVEQAMTDEQARLAAAQQAVADAEANLQALNPDDIELELANAEKAVEQTKQAVASREKERDDLRAELRALGQQGLSEQEQELARKVEEAERAYRALERGAQAVWLAADALETAAGEARQRYHQPLLRHLQPYLRQVFPNAEPAINDTLGLDGLRRGGQAENFNQLSIGAREQVAVLMRLAFADLLAESSDEAPPVILDDALVYADGDRFETMKFLLSKSAQKHQVIILTCRPMDYLSLGAKQFRLAETG